MIELTGNLSERHRQLNLKVKETISSNNYFDEIKDTDEQYDIDRIFKIDVASEHKNVNYLIETLKSGDALYISRALKSVWVFDDEFSYVINTDYLHHNVFPVMSIKMKNKFLSTASQFITNADRAASFFTYCVDIKLDSIAYKFLIFTSESFKIDVFSGNPMLLGEIFSVRETFLKHLIKESFLLSDTLLETPYQGSRGSILYEIRYLYSVSDIKYLDLMEKYEKQNSLYMKRFGLRLSKDIVKKHKDRVRRMPMLYIGIIDDKILVKYSTVEDAKMYAVGLFPEKDFWHSDYCNNYKHILNLIPNEDKFNFVKGLYEKKYPNETFETSIAFYNSGAYYLMTTKQKEAWALQQIANGLEILGSGNDFRWYRFVNFDRAFKEIKKYIMITSDKDKRPEMLNILVKSAKNQRDLEKLFTYYYDRHVNEKKNIKLCFIDEVTREHNVYEFDDMCWEAFDKILYSLDVYDTTEFNIYILSVISIIYHIVKSRDLPETLKKYLDLNYVSVYYIKSKVENLPEEKKSMVYAYLINFYTEKLSGIFEKHDQTEDIKFQLRKYIHNILDLLILLKKKKDDCPELVLNRAKLDWEEFQYHEIFKESFVELTQDDLLRLLKKDANLVVEKLPAMRDCMRSTSEFKLNQLMKKLKVYFEHDAAKTCVDFFFNLLDNTDDLRLISASVRNIFQLADDTFKVNFMEKYAPTASKIDHKSIDYRIRCIQSAICSHACASRPPVPLKTMLKYVKGDYVHYCLPMFNSYLAHLPQHRCIEFVESLLNTPVSIQKHGLRLAFVCFSMDNLLNLFTSVWGKTKNVSLRKILFKAVYDKILVTDSETRLKLFKSLKMFILDLNKDDDKDLFQLVISGDLPLELRGDAVESLWITVVKLPERATVLNLVLDVIQRIEKDMHSIRDEVIRSIVEDNVNSSFVKQHVDKEKFESEKAEIFRAKWQLTAKYVTQIRSNEELNAKLDLTKRIVTQYFDKWNDVISNEYVTRRGFCNFIAYLDHKGYQHDVECYEYINVLIETILEMVQKRVLSETVYSIVWHLKINIATRKVIIDGSSKFSDALNLDDKYLIIRDIGSKFAKELFVVFTEFIEQNMYYSSFLSNIADEILSYTGYIESYFAKYFSYKLNVNDLKVVLCIGLWVFKMPVLNLLIVKLVPSDLPTYFIEDYKTLLSDLVKLNDKEVCSSFYNKFYSDFKHRPFLPSSQ